MDADKAHPLTKAAETFSLRWKLAFISIWKVSISWFQRNPSP